MQVGINEGIFGKEVFIYDVKVGDQQAFEIPFKPGVDFNDILHIRVDCNCTAPEIWADSIKGVYTDSGTLQGIKEIKEKYIYVFLKKPGIPAAEQYPFVVNDAGQSVPDWDGYPFQTIKLIFNVTK